MNIWPEHRLTRNENGDPAPGTPAAGAVGRMTMAGRPEPPCRPAQESGVNMSGAVRSSDRGVIPIPSRAAHVEPWK